MTSVRTPWTFLMSGILLSIGIVLIATPNLLGPVDTLATMLRATGRYAFLLFLPVFLAAPLHRLAPSIFTATLLRYRGGLGLLLAGNQIVHLGLILTIFEVSPTAPQPPEVVMGGTIGMLLIGAMAVTSFRDVTDRIPQKLTKAIHLMGTGYLLFFVFVFDILVSVFTKSPQEVYVTLSALYFLALAIKLCSYAARRPAPLTAA